MKYSRANVKCEQRNGYVILEENCQRCGERDLCGGDCEIKWENRVATGPTKCVLITSTTIAIKPSSASIDTSIATKTASNGLSDMSVVSTSIFNATSSTYLTKGPLSIQSMESAKTTEVLPKTSDVQGNSFSNNIYSCLNLK